MDIKELRKKIDNIDEKIVSLLRERMETSAKVGQYKKENKLPIYDPSRESELFDRVASLAGKELSSYTRVLYSTITDISRSYQRKVNGNEGELSKRMQNALQNTEKLFPEGGVVACQGVEGAYSQLACRKIFKSPSIMYFESFEDVFRAVDKKLCRYGVLPIENSTAGSVNKIYDLMAKFKFHIVRSTRVRVAHALLAKKGAELSGIKEIYSHPQAISQCSEFLESLGKGVKVTECENTAVAAKMVAESGKKEIAALSSRDCALLYGLKNIASSIQDMGNNYTRFICISKDLEIYPGADKTTIMAVAANTPGALFNLLSHFFAHGINLTKLESRPIPDRDFEFMFYFDIDVSIYSPKYYAVISELEKICEDFRFLGSYSENVG